MVISDYATRFDDDLAGRTQWSCVRQGKFVSSVLRQTSDQRMTTRMRLSARIFVAFVVVVGIAIVAAPWVAPALDQVLQPDVFKYFVSGVGVIFAGFGVAFYLVEDRRTVFDKHSGCFWQGKGAKEPVFTTPLPKGMHLLEDIHAIQLIKDLASYPASYELNLVLRSAERLNVIDHRFAFEIRADAEKLAAFLQVPIWDACDQHGARATCCTRIP